MTTLIERLGRLEGDRTGIRDSLKSIESRIPQLEKGVSGQFYALNIIIRLYFNYCRVDQHQL
jgi:hypothetical protein